jgi:propionyl-CoA carboxylase beta chain
LYSRDLKKETDEAKKEELKQKMTQEYSDKFASPYQAATNGSIDEVIEPSQARHKIIRAFQVLVGKRDPKRNPHKGNIPL